ncbi:hypothetical protein ENUP19_0083G0028 [Entamoeba nuttalli]|uniref:TLC domain-containing protein n=2 Tax=Entamoeba nuttalli TaxID=412467 RepID=K2H6M4_ENTNP|nr:hypothetical protein ENU1_030530 [Entamoeba nuttalli P19]EKE42152.1 hypothetical protein ENU1_030530 [Entamoeba nuttalli P19]|eukprot:XP_008855507.1 hypothetical protein ENU1_030530 [Entamoeba nuttalli P19]
MEDEILNDPLNYQTEGVQNDQTHFHIDLALIPLILIYLPLIFTFQINSLAHLMKGLVGTIIPCCIISGCRIIIEYFILRPLFHSVLPFSLPKLRRREKGHLYATSIYDIGINLILIPFSFHIFRLEDWFPSELFGKEETNSFSLFENYPNTPLSSSLLFFICFQLGHIIHSIIFQFVTSFTQYNEIAYQLLKGLFLIYAFIIHYYRFSVIFIIILDILEVIKNIEFLKQNLSIKFSFILSLCSLLIILRVLYIIPFCLIKPLFDNYSILVDEDNKWLDIGSFIIVFLSTTALLFLLLFDIILLYRKLILGWYSIKSQQLI